MEEPLVSIVVATKKTPQYLDLCVRSILMHTDVNYELIIVCAGNDHLTDKILADAEKLVPIGKPPLLAFKILSAPEDSKYAQSNYDGCKEARGKFLVFLNSDAIVTPNWLPMMLSVYEGNKNAFPVGLIGAKSTNISGPQDLAKGWQERPFCFPRVVTVCTLISRDTFLDVGGWDLTFPANNYTDDDLCVRLIKNGYKNMIVPMLVFHFGGRTFLATNTDYDADMKAGADAMIAKHGKDWKNYYKTQLKSEGLDGGEKY